MKRSWLIGLVILAGAALLSDHIIPGTPNGRTIQNGGEARSEAIGHPTPATVLCREAQGERSDTADLPQRAQDALTAIQQRGGEPPPNHIGGRIFYNRERCLPPGRYREYDVNPKLPGRPRDAERLVIEQSTGKAYYTPDHYGTLIPMN